MKGLANFSDKMVMYAPVFRGVFLCFYKILDLFNLILSSSAMLFP